MLREVEELSPGAPRPRPTRRHRCSICLREWEHNTCPECCELRRWITQSLKDACNTRLPVEDLTVRLALYTLRASLGIPLFSGLESGEDVSRYLLLLAQEQDKREMDRRNRA